MRIRLNNVRHARRIPDSSAPPPLPVPFYARMEEAAARETTDERRRYDDEAFSLTPPFVLPVRGKQILQRRLGMITRDRVKT